jgi:hypothetical protein
MLGLEGGSTGTDGLWQCVLRSSSGPARSLRLRVLSESVSLPPVLDGLVMAVLPIAMREGGPLRIEGCVTRGALRNASEFTEAWSKWDPQRYTPVEVIPDEITDHARLAEGHDAVFAWSGSLRSTHTFVRHRHGLVRAPYRAKRVLRVLGLSSQPDPDRDQVESLRKTVARMGGPLVVVDSNAAVAGFIDPEIGVLPIVAAALHAVGEGCTAGIHSRPWLLAAQRRYPRPGLALPDLLSGDRFAIRADGGTSSMSRMVRDLIRHRCLGAVTSNCVVQPRHLPPCGECPRCVAMALALLAAAEKQALGSSVGLRHLFSISFGDPVFSSDVEAILQDWTSTHTVSREAWRSRAAIARLGVSVVDHLRWLGSATGLRPPWPR